MLGYCSLKASFVLISEYFRFRLLFFETGRPKLSQRKPSTDVFFQELKLNSNFLNLGQTETFLFEFRILKTIKTAN